MKQSTDPRFLTTALIFPGALLSLFAIFSLTACSTLESASPRMSSGHVEVGDTIPRGPDSNSGSAARDLATARRMIKAGESSLVIPRLQSLVDRYPGDVSAISARFFLGQAYYKVGAYTDAHRWLNEYLGLVPDGEFSEESHQLLAQISGDGQASAEEDDLSALAAAIVADPDAMAPRLAYANALWEGGRYEEAGPVYDALLARWPQLASAAAVSRRVERDASGSLIVLSPEEMQRRYREEEPLRIYNVSSFRSGRFEGLPSVAREKFYNVAGQAVNQSESALDDVRITVTIYGFGQMVYDTQTISLGTLRPREVRAFSAQFSRFDDIHNVRRHECVGCFRR